MFLSLGLGIHTDGGCRLCRYAIIKANVRRNCPAPNSQTTAGAYQRTRMFAEWRVGMFASTGVFDETCHASILEHAK